MGYDHAFDIRFACKYGIECAIFIQHFDFKLQWGKTHHQHFHDGKWWFRTGIQSLIKLYPYLKTQRKVQYVLDKLRKFDIIETGNFNESPYDKTNWYTFTDSFLQSSVDNGDGTKIPVSSIIRFCTIEDTKPENGVKFDDTKMYHGNTKKDIPDTTLYHGTHKYASSNKGSYIDNIEKDIEEPNNNFSIDSNNDEMAVIKQTRAYYEQKIEILGKDRARTLMLDTLQATLKRPVTIEEVRQA